MHLLFEVSTYAVNNVACWAQPTASEIFSVQNINGASLHVEIQALGAPA